SAPLLATCRSRTTKGPPAKPAAPSACVRSYASRRLSDGTHVLCLGTLLPLGHVELDLLVLLEVPVAGSRDRREVDEHVRSALLGDEAVPLLGVEPLQHAGCHTAIPSFPGPPGLAVRRPGGPFRAP